MIHKNNDSIKMIYIDGCFKRPKYIQRGKDQSITHLYKEEIVQHDGDICHRSRARK